MVARTALVQRLRRVPGVIIERSQQLIVSTSGRLEGRCHHGLAATLATLEGLGRLRSVRPRHLVARVHISDGGPPDNERSADERGRALLGGGHGVVDLVHEPLSVSAA
jgi:hypothetical protein